MEFPWYWLVFHWDSFESSMISHGVSSISLSVDIYFHKYLVKLRITVQESLYPGCMFISKV